MSPLLAFAPRQERDYTQRSGIEPIRFVYPWLAAETWGTGAMNLVVQRTAASDFSQNRWTQAINLVGSVSLAKQSSFT